MASKCKNFLCSLLPIFILFISLFQLYFHYSTIVTPRSKDFYEKDDQHEFYNFQIGDKQFDLNLEKLNENFDDSPLMNINILKNATMKGFQKINERREKKIDERIYMLFYLIFHDIIYLIIVYIFYFGGCKAGIIKIIFQILRFYFNSRRIKLSNPNLCPFQVIMNYYYYNIGIRGWNIFTPEGFGIFEYLCNYVIILDCIWLYIIIKGKKSEQKENIVIKEISDSQKVDNIKKKDNEQEKEGMSEKNNNIDNIVNNISESNKENEISTGKINVDEGYEEEESEHISEEPINEQETN